MPKLDEKRAVLVVGATGQVGSCLTQQILTNADYLVNILVRDEQRVRAQFGDGIDSGRPRLFLTQKLTSDTY